MHPALYGVTPRQLVSVDVLERVDVFKGANAFLNGASPTGSAIGGGVNLELKRADDKPRKRKREHKRKRERERKRNLVRPSAMPAKNGSYSPRLPTWATQLL